MSNGSKSPDTGNNCLHFRCRRRAAVVSPSPAPAEGAHDVAGGRVHDEAGGPPHLHPGHPLNTLNSHHSAHPHVSFHSCWHFLNSSCIIKKSLSADKYFY